MEPEGGVEPKPSLSESGDALRESEHIRTYVRYYIDGMHGTRRGEGGTEALSIRIWGYVTRK